MPIQSSSTKPRVKTPRGTPRGLPPEVIIEFSSLNRTNGSIPHELNEFEAARPAAGTVVWYHSLKETERQIKGLQLHETLQHPPFVILFMNDGSFLLFDISIRNPLVAEVTRIWDLDAANLTPASIQVEFSSTSANGTGNAYVDLKFAIAICYGFLNCISQSPIKRDALACQRLFALAFFVSIIRRSLPIDGHLLENINTIPTVDQFWNEVLSPSLAGQILWEDNIVPEVHQAVREGIHATARDRLRTSAVFNAVPQTLADREMSATEQLGIPKLATTSLESAAHKGRSLASTSWCIEWDKNWGVEWKNNWNKNWNIEERAYLKLVSPARFMPDFLTSGALSGNAAGNSIIEVDLVANTILKDRATETETPLIPQTERASTTPVESEDKPLPSNHPNLQVEETNKRHTDSHLEAESRWFEFWYSIRRPHSKQPRDWLPAWEAAYNTAWALSRKTHSEGTGVNKGGVDTHTTNQEKKPVQSRDNILTSLIGIRGRVGLPRGISLSPRRNPGVGPVSTPVTLVRALGQMMNFGHLNMSQKNDDSNTNEIKLDLQKLSEIAWNEVCGCDLGVSRYISEQGEEVHNLLREEFPEYSTLTENNCKKIFETILRKTWQTCWERAWHVVMNDALWELKEWKRAYTEETATNRTLMPSEIHQLDSYIALKQYMETGESQDEQRRILSAFKASNILHRTLDHSVPLCYKGVMTIRYFPDRPYELSTPNPGPKLKTITKVIQSDRVESISHSRLQTTIQSLAHTNRVPKFPKEYSPLTSIEQVWRTAHRVELDGSFMPNSSSGPKRSTFWPGRKAHIMKRPERKNTINQARDRARYLWQKTIKELLARKSKASASPSQVPPADNAVSEAPITEA